MIKSFKCKETEKIFRREISRKISLNLQKIARRKLVMIADACNLTDLRLPPGNRLELLKGNLKGWYSIRINNQWRICFQWKNDNAINVYIDDYH